MKSRIKLLSHFALPLAALSLAALAQTSAPSSQPALPTITLHLPKASLVDIQNEIARQAHMKITTNRFTREELLDPKYSIDVDHQPVWQVLHLLCALMGAVPAFSESWLTLEKSTPAWSARPFTIVDGFLITADSAKRSQYKDFEKTEEFHSFGITCTLYQAPGVKLLGTWGVHVDEATDSDGRNLVPLLQTPSPLNQIDTSFGASTGTATFTAPLEFSNADWGRTAPQAAGHRLTTFRGTLRCAVETKSEYWVIENPLTTKDALHKYPAANGWGGERLWFVGLTPQGEGYNLEIQTDAVGKDDPLLYDCGSRIHILDAVGREMSHGGGGASHWEGGGIFHFSTFRVTSQPPVLVVINVPVAIEIRELHFAFKDLPIP